MSTDTINVICLRWYQPYEIKDQKMKKIVIVVDDRIFLKTISSRLLTVEVLFIASWTWWLISMTDIDFLQDQKNTV